MTENEEFEFRLRLEQEQASKKGPGAMEKLGKGIEKLNMPGRGFRGMAVGAEKLMRPVMGAMIPGSGITTNQTADFIQNAPEALNRAAAAVQPGFEPQDMRERMAGTLGYEGATMAMLPGAAQVAGRGIGAAARGVKALGQNVLEGPATRSLATLRNTASNLPVDKLAKEQMVEQARKVASQSIEKARNAAGVPQKLHDVSKIDTNDFANMMKNLEPKTKNLKTLLSLRDRADAVIRAGVDDAQRAFIRRGMSKIDTQIAKASKSGEKIAEAYKQYGETMSAADDIPGDILKKRVATSKEIRRLSPKAQKEKLIRKLGAGALGVGGIWHAFK